MGESQFNIFGINEKLIEKLDKRKIICPTKIQKAIIPKILKGNDVIGQSMTGTGKTIAFIIPLINMLLESRSLNVLIIAPTKDLATQIYQESLYYTDSFDIRPILLIAGSSLDDQIKNLGKRSNFIIGVPGRILKLTEKGNLKLSEVKKLVLDEVDFLIDLGFKDDLEKIMSLAKNINQMMTFSATYSSKTKKLLDIIKNQKYAVRVDVQNTLPETIENYFFPIRSDEQREKELLKILEIITPYLSIIFTRTKQECNWLYKILKEKKYSVCCLNGDLSPAQRKKNVKEFKNAKTQYLVATDLASRGLDFEGITHIINYSLPVGELDYLHRAGRTGRMNEKGIVYSICNELDEGYLKKYTYKLGILLQPLKIKEDTITPYKNYSGSKPRFNLKEKKQLFKRQKEKKNGRKKKSNKKRR